MKKIFFIIFAAVAIAGLFYYRAPGIRNYPSSGTDVVAFGDSLVVGVGSSKTGGFVSMLSEELDVPIVNLGVSGDTTLGALVRISELDKYEPKVVIVLLGGNDYLASVPPEETFRNLSKIVDAIQARGSAVILVGIGSNFDKEFENLAVNKKAAYVPDILENIFENSKLMSDSLHPNDEGYKLMAERIKPILEKLLK
ncbi:MAG: hypothetical protein A3F53_00010 [Candidatus Zambryskibacteria bacterium RIFCSPHIGHO2_12_FULL_48_10]|uniref:SGNH hydrolase-type esterase domain-containing protein n=1 Tax=Candidatus Zambryskibacteria bacterium RIFCSPHIGHO2_01_FULL_46_25 TaxID=1802738 RepID=A0A1G2SZ55_9BACT|nr:MAG: Lipolytic protein family [Parcubacteria group bacterium GW2011_GWA1_47_10]OHA90337.1 MAG: hypothetical protein A2838_01920 [Candidatus Zambryskibacteria bacterium RIFCSPHIGHO2_01_FULL_46_25]OHB01264.1 MAG: hypothetical protein A3F53_00010 [Candidatus Zambryskibacteria bacterium RIFCSPHIGHO2_12_FULL_48_10]OHB06878.1 MAG: hypothetical protein A3A31_01070 [Candidatus Zambryskibacteria bacterium RIFCSPLOWO2_01_FULL_48_25]